MFYVINRAFLAVTQDSNKPAKYISYVNLHEDRKAPDVGAMLLNFLLALENRLRGRDKTMPDVNYREEYNLSGWLWRMSATSFDESGNTIPRSEA